MKNELISRDTIFSTIKDIILLDDKVCQFVPVTGKGGTGKTMLFNQIQEYFDSRREQFPNVLVINYDYRDLKSQSLAGTLYSNVCRMLAYDETLFQLDDVEQFFNLLLTDPNDISSLINLTMTGLQSLIEKGIRLVLLEDTIEVINTPSEYIQNTFMIGSFLPNCVAIVAGRPEDNTFGHLDVINTALGTNDWIIHSPLVLNTFTLAETVSYLKSHFNAEIPDSQLQKIHLLTNGSPIHLAVVTEVIKSNPDLGILKLDLDELKRQFEVDRSGLLSRFEYDLLSEISSLAASIDWTVLYLAYLNRRYDRRIIKALIGGTDLEVKALEDKFKSLLYLRKSSLPSRESREMLHDEIQRMINTLVWDRIDYLKEHRRTITHKVIDAFYTPEIQRCKNILDEMEAQLMERDQLIRYLDMSFTLAELQNECLDYLLRIDVPGGLAYFEQLVDEANQSSYPNFNRLLLHDGVKNISLSRFMPADEIEKAIYRL